MLHQSRDLWVLCPEFPIPNRICDFLLFPNNNSWSFSWSYTTGKAQKQLENCSGESWAGSTWENVFRHPLTPPGQGGHWDFCGSGYLWNIGQCRLSVSSWTFPSGLGGPSCHPVPWFPVLNWDLMKTHRKMSEKGSG